MLVIKNECNYYSIRQAGSYTERAALRLDKGLEICMVFNGIKEFKAGGI